MNEGLGNAIQVNEDYHTAPLTAAQARALNRQMDAYLASKGLAFLKQQFTMGSSKNFTAEEKRAYLDRKVAEADEKARRLAKARANDGKRRGSRQRNGNKAR